MPTAMLRARRLLLTVAAVVPLALSYDEDAWDRVLHAHVAPGALEGIPTNIVDYAAVAKDPDFGAFVKSLEAANTSSLSKNETYALFMNAYNALAIKMVADHACKRDLAGRCAGPIASIRDVGKATSVWDKPAGKIGGRVFSLQQVEDFLRAPGSLGEDARLHACIVCASISCPNLRPEAFRARSIDAQMTAQMTNMLSSPKKGMKLDRSAGVITLSKIFSWYAGDFEKAAGGVLDFILPYVPSPADRAYIASHKASLRVEYFDYDWNANGKPPCHCAAVTRI
eukprot:CAMPEP_0204602580 /NCGR_PEP_ID=MMETSP0661-20131031/56732_1 /ASSEMBLY_ACC=CAM_ASM_000606 /TAXON_ID=109239 /ORGANISM="Alexandrium margalefi, Strain AMGDE01CS-322" /LENGTH=282 /DNA_ID=CAMNT_0051613549 /DNA_START=35 /DNA_END=883 /DNA_ORIENTATION=+